MSRRVTRKPEVRRELAELADHISQDNLDAALRFLDAAEQTFLFLAAHREVGQLCNFSSSDAHGVQVWRIDNFKNYLVFYRPSSEGVDIIRVLHGSRDIEEIFSAVS